MTWFELHLMRFRPQPLKIVFLGLTCAATGSYSMTFFKCGAEVVSSTSSTLTKHIEKSVREWRALWIFFEGKREGKKTALWIHRFFCCKSFSCFYCKVSWVGFPDSLEPCPPCPPKNDHTQAAAPGKLRWKWQNNQANVGGNDTVDGSEIRLTTCYLWNPMKNG